MAAAIVVALTSTMLAACNDPESGACERTLLTIDDIVVATGDTPLVLSARLVTEKDAKPIAGVKVDFLLKKRTESGERAVGDGGIAGRPTTDADGIASVTLPHGAVVTRVYTDIIDGYGAQFTPLGFIDGVQYCRTAARAAVRLEN